METPREFRAAWAGALFVMLLAIFTRDTQSRYEAYTLASLGVALPFAIFRVFVSSEQNRRAYQGVSGFALFWTGCGTLGAFAFEIWSISTMAGVTFLVAVSVAAMMLLFGKKS